MDTLRYHQCLSNIQFVSRNYPSLKKIEQETGQLLEQIESRRYRVAVIGEFKRGKSSLINALLGAEILPTNCLPTTAVINRVVYDSQQKIVIHYKDGTTQVCAVKDLTLYATKMTRENEARALTIRRIDLHYPSLFNQSGIELWDTPGINEDELMTQTTLSVLEKIDTALVVIHAAMPLSESEQKLICNLIEQEQIYHLTFVVTFIDKISEDQQGQDAVVAFIAARLQNETYDRFCSEHDDPRLLQKAQAILKNAKIFGVSAKAAMQGFIKNDNELVRKSRFPLFKQELTGILTAAQEEDFRCRAEKIARELRDSFPQQHRQTVEQLSEKLKRMPDRALAEDFIQNSRRSMAGSMVVMLEALQKVESIFDPIPICRKNAGSSGFLSVSSKQTKIWNALVAYKQQMTRCMQQQMQQIVDEQEQKRRMAGLPENRLRDAAQQWTQANPEPEAYLKREALYALLQDDPQRAVALVREKIERYQEAIQTYCAQWRRCLLDQNDEDTRTLRIYLDTAFEDVRTLQETLDSIEKGYEVHLKMIEDAVDGILRSDQMNTQ